MKKTLLLALALCSAAALRAEVTPADPETPVQPDSAAVAETPAETAVETPAQKSPVATAVEAVQNALAATGSDIKFGGYIIGKYSYTSKHGEKSNSSFDLRLVRLYVDGHAFKDFYYKLQLQVNGQPGEDKGARIVDAFVEWQHFKEFRVKIGQFKRSFGYENPMNPLDVGFGAYSQASTKLIGFNDRVGEHACNGRDVGLQFQGDFFPMADGHRFLHYQVGVFNGQGVNHTDKDNFKDLIGGLWISPVKGMRVGGFGWNGKYTNENYTGAPGTLASTDRVRWGLSAEYMGDWQARGEYVWSKGRSVKNASLSKYADAWYIQGALPKCHGFQLGARWDCYRDTQSWNSLKQIYELALTYYFNKNLFIQAEYDFTHDKTLASHRNYNTLGVQVYCRF
ncbi:MAG: porin [Bacteroidaceae bacterium]|nr:porin [Bacteroidaceae bacterium]